jgi:hypothetical protein
MRKGPTPRRGAYMEKIKNIRRRGVAIKKDHHERHQNTTELQSTIGGTI